MGVERKLTPTHEAPYRGLRVLDFGQGVASPYCAMLLAVYGADVIKVEPPEGDWSRYLGTTYGNHTTLSAVYNRGKRSLCLDMKHAAGDRDRQAAGAECDVLIEGFRPGVAARLGIGYEELSRDNPGLIYLSVSAFGQSGPYAKRPGSDSVAQAFSGLVSVNVGNDGTPHRVGSTIADVVTGVYALPGDSDHAVRARDHRHRPLDRRQSRVSRPRRCSATKLPSMSWRAALRAPSTCRPAPTRPGRLDDGHAGERAAVQAALRGDRTGRSRQRSALCRFREARRFCRRADGAIARDVPDTDAGDLAHAAFRPPTSSPSTSLTPGEWLRNAHVEATKAAVCQDTPGMGAVYTARTPGIAGPSEDDLRPAPDIGQTAAMCCCDAGFDAGCHRRSDQRRHCPHVRPARPEQQETMRHEPRNSIRYAVSDGIAEIMLDRAPVNALSLP